MRLLIITLALIAATSAAAQTGIPSPRIERPIQCSSYCYPGTTMCETRCR